MQMIFLTLLERMEQRILGDYPAHSYCDFVGVMFVIKR